MTPTQLLGKATTQKIGKTPVVVLSVKDWQKINDMLEDFEMMKSENYRKNIAKSRASKNLYEFNPNHGTFKKLRRIT